MSDQKELSPYEKVMARHERETYVRYTSDAKTADDFRRQMIERFEIKRSAALNRLASYESPAGGRTPKYLKDEARREAALYDQELYFLAKVEFVEKKHG